jgi:hypothetical protein
VLRDQWPRALLRAALREVGYDAAGTRTLTGALRLAEPETGRGAVGLILLGREAFSAEERPDLERLRTTTQAPILFLAGTGSDIEDGPWTLVLRRPISVGELVRAIERVLPLPSGAQHPID